MPSAPLISVIIPCFNAEKWISKSINSILNQTYNNFEILIFNDGSIDSSLSIIKGLAKKSDIKIINSQQNTGIVRALNYLVREAQGDFIARMDADDVAHPQRLERQIKWIEDQQIDLCGTWFKEFGQGIPRVNRWPTSHQALEAALLFQNTICHPTIMGKRKVFEDLPYRQGFNLAEDYDFFSRAIGRYKLGNLPLPLLHYRRHSNQATQAKKEEMELIARKIRISALNSIGIHPNPEQVLIHNMIRGPNSITDIKSLHEIERWLEYLLNDEKPVEFNTIIANQWIRACIRAAPLGYDMYKKYRSSFLLKESNAGFITAFDMVMLAILQLDYNSKAFKVLRRIGLSA